MDGFKVDTSPISSISHIIDSAITEGQTTINLSRGELLVYLLSGLFAVRFLKHHSFKALKTHMMVTSSAGST